ncbi:hypothetical protein N802_17280 [Knoellia sinensis KCTC 19936]|uniref:Uncharacterized protein n=1 Tax=Knoellia sinensis KCTC 19936 TaxID=1385520 RepID=A0A0A0J657_9MICO|nr:hypothetical protein [Knoellia sinensis]KGN32698.1 hypothetical protein N802_17280 [Knoellia sinensis KCTC 19936]
MILRSATVALVVTSALAISGCTSPDPASPSPTERTITWERVALPEGVSAVTLASTPEDVIVGAVGAGRTRPRLLKGPDPESLTQIPLSPGSPYAYEARWFQIATHEDRIDAIGGARGGAHGNYRWSTWTGSGASVAEQEQPFGVFGSYGAGDLAGVAYAGGSPVILGAWQSESTGQDIATWSRSGDRWARLPSTGTPLGSTADELLSATAIASHGTGLVLTGSVTHLDPGAVTVSPAVWLSPGPTGPWTRVDLPRTGGAGTSEVHAATCHTECLLTGVTDGRLSVWQAGGESPGELSGIPAVRVDENARVLAPVGPAGSEILVVPQDRSSAVLFRDGDAWQRGRGPTGMPVSAVAHGDELWVVTTDDAGAGTLWRARVA